jgi:flagellar hook-length control protein FliK
MKQKMMTTENESMTSTLNEKNLSVQQEINRAGIEESNNPKLRQELFSTPKEAGFFVESKAPVVTNQSELVPKEVMSSRLQQWIDVSQKIIGTIENGFKVLLNQGDNKISIRLYPPELGKVEIEVAVKGNQVNARILTENQAVKEVVLGNLEQLRSSIQNLEYNIQKIEVELGSFKNGFEHRSANEPDSQGQSSGNRQHPDNSNLYLTSFKDAAEVIWERQPFSSFQGLQVNLLI